MCHFSVRSFKPKILESEGNADLFKFLLFQMSKVSWYKQRLKALLFKARFADKVEEIKPVSNKPAFVVSCCLGFTDRKSSRLSKSRKIGASGTICFTANVVRNSYETTITL